MIDTAPSTAQCSGVNPGAPPLLIFADDWGRHPSSCQHLVKRLRNHYPIVWVNSIGTRQVRADSFTWRRGIEKLRGWSKGVEQVAERMWVIDLPMIPSLGKAWFKNLNRTWATVRLQQILQRLGLGKPVVFTTLPYVYALIRDLPRQSFVYYCTDDYSFWPSADRIAMQEAEKEAVAHADLILAASRTLTAKFSSHPNCHYLPHGVDYEHFAREVPAEEVPSAIADLPLPRIGYFGLIYEKLNYALLSALAARFAGGSLVMMGPVVHCPPEFAQLPNVKLLGPVPYKELPATLQGMDVLILPYVDDEMIRQSGPLKVRECLATGKPTVCIDIADLRAFQGHVRIAENEEAFVQEVEQALAESGNLTAQHARQHVVAGESWDERAKVVRRHLTAMPDSASGLAPRQASRNGSSANGITRYHSTPPRKITVLETRVVTGAGGGPDKTILNSPRFLERSRYRTICAFMHPPDDPGFETLRQRAAAWQAPLVSIPDRGPLDHHVFDHFARLCRQENVGIWHAHDYKSNLLGLLLRQRWPMRLITTMHGYVENTSRTPFYYALDRLTLRHYDLVICVSEDLRRRALSSGVPPKRCVVIENAIDTEEYSRRQDVSAAKQRLGLSPERLLIGGVGRLSPEKGFDLLIRAVDQMTRSGLDIGLILLGEGSERETLQKLIQELGQNDRIQLCGQQSDPRPYFQAMDIFALSSLREGLPNALLEALAMEVPAVATRIAGVPRVIQAGQNGLLVDPGSLEQLTQALTQVATSGTLREQLRLAGRETIVTRYSFKHRMEKIRCLYDKLMAGDRQRRRSTADNSTFLNSSA